MTTITCKVSVGVFLLLYILQYDNSNIKMRGLSPMDPSSFSRPELVIVNDIKISLNVDFEKKIFNGHVILSVQKIVANTNEVILDSKDLTISQVYDVDLQQPLKFTVGDSIGELGSKIIIQLPSKESDTYSLKIDYETSPKASGVQWLTPVQTAGKKLPFVFSQFQAVHARSIIPCQDTPYVKMPYSAEITIPKELTVVMSANFQTKKEMEKTSMFSFNQKIPIPSYLIAFAVGALESKKIGPRSSVWAEKEVIDKAVYEFAETENLLKTAESICGPYIWGNYDLLVLPPTFPFGGMENPCMTFVTPTLLAGDRSLVNVIAHEIAHSWTGNLVTNSNFEHFWLNEGFTMFIERKIIGRLVGSKQQDFEAYCGTSSLKETVNRLDPKNPLTKLVVDLSNTHPDDAFSAIPYEKGHTFLRYLENTVGGPDIFEPFLHRYFEAFKFKSIDTNDFKSFFENYFGTNVAIKAVDWKDWLYKSGMPPMIPEYDTTLIEMCNHYKNLWVNWDESQDEAPFTKEDIQKLSSNQIIQLLQEIIDSKPQSELKLKKISDMLGFETISNAEIKFRWLRIGLKAHWKDIVEPTLEWLNEVGRLKYVKPLYRALYEWEEVREIAIDNFKKHQNEMMYVTAYAVSNELHLKF